MTMKRNDMQRMIIEGVRRLLCGVQPAQEAMGAGSIDHLTGVNRSLEPAQTAFSSGTDGHSSGKKRPFFRQRTAVLSAKNARSLGKEQQFPREEIFVPSGGNNIFLGRKSFFPRLDMSFSFPHLALRFLLVIVLILGGVLESGAQTTVGDESALKKAISNGGTQTIKLTADISLSSTLTIDSEVNITLDLNGKTLSLTTVNKKAIAIELTSGRLVITGNGAISAKATYKLGLLGYDAISVSYNGGTLLINNATFRAEAFGYGTAYTLDPNNGYTVNAMVPYGAYIVGGVDKNYSSTGLESTSTTVSLSNYTATFDPKGGKLTGPLSVSYTIENTSPFIQQLEKQPTRRGYDFDRWLVTPDTAMVNGVPVLKDRQATGTITYTAQWLPISYTIKYTGLVGADQTVDYDITRELSLLQPTKKGYTFKGWKDKNGNTVSGITYDAVSNNAENGVYTLTAQWEKNTYTITYKSEGQIISSDTFQIGSTKILLNLLDKEGAKFEGWKDAVTNEKLTALPGDSPRNLTLEAIWSYLYTITYHTGTSENIDNTTHQTTKEATLPKPRVNKDGYTFSHWIDQNGRVFIDNIPANTYTKDAGTVTLTAVWTPDTYYLYYKEDDQIIDVLTKEFTTETETFSLYVPDERDWFVFEGWYDGDQEVKEVTKGRLEGLTVTAKWTAITYVLTYDYGYDIAKDTAHYTYQQRADKPLLSPTRTGYNFLGWFAAGATDHLTMRPVDKSVKKKEVPITITADWDLQTYPVTFYLNDGTNAALSEQAYLYSVEAGIPAAQMPGENEAQRTGYTFDSWNTKEDGTGTTVTEVAAGTEELKFYAQWKPNEYNITYHWNGGEILSDAPSKFVYNVGVTLPKKEEMHKDHYDFAGWTREVSSMNYVQQIDSSQYAEHQTFYAQWAPATYTIQFNTNTEATVADLNYLYGSEVMLKKSYRNGFTFGGWYFDAALTDPVGDKVTSSTIEDNSPRAITFYAKWNPIQYTITYDTYGGTIQSGKVDSYRTGEEVTLPTDVKRDGFSFAGWYADDLLTHLATNIEAGEYGNKTFYATWSRGFSVILSQPKEGVISVKQGEQAIASGTPLSKGAVLTISAVPTTSGYVLQKLVINGKEFTTSPQTVTMGEANLIVSATFVASTKPTVSAPTITTDPDQEKVDAETLVKVTLAKSDAASTLYYALNDQQARPYTAPFVVDGGIGDTVTIRAIARREGYTDGITTRRIVFDGRLHLTFDLPEGVTATAPDGGSVVDAIVKGGTFEFKLQVDKNYFSSTDSLQVLANDSLIAPGSSGVYRLYDQKGDVKVVVKGLKARLCTVTLLQTDHGQIAFAEGEEESSCAVAYNTELKLQATADEDYKFSKWSTGSQQNPVTIRVVSDTTFSATFVNDYKAYQITLPEVEGVTTKPFTGYSTEVKRDGTFKFYLVIANGYHEEQLVVRADGEELVKNKGGYALYHITKNIRISVEGIARDAFALTLPPNVQAWKLATMEEAAKASLYAETTLLLQAMAPEGQRFLKWTDGSTENPRTATALDAKQLYPLFTTLSEIPTAKVSLEQTAGAGITGATSNLGVANLGDQLSVKVVVLPAYSQSEVRLLANGQSVEPQARLRAASEAKSYYYQVPVAQADVKLKVEGLRLNQYQLTVAESTGGRVEGVPSGKVMHGDTVSLTAKAAEGMTFVRWWDGNTLNPYPYPVTGDQTIRAYFVGESSPVDNESVTAEEVRVCSPTTGGLWVELPVPQDIWLWDSSGRLLLHRFESGTFRLAVPAGIYLLQCGMRPAFKVVVRQ